jgi:DNA polymerase I
MKKAPQASEAQSPRSGKLFIIDGNSFLYRAYYAIGPLSNSKGEPTNALYGFIAMMRKLLADMKPESMAVCWDRKEATFRHDKYEDYKKHRKPMPEDLVQQIAPIKEYCRLSRYAMFEKAGFEADDLIGTIAARGASEGYEIFIVTGDKDAMQLVNDKVKILMPHKYNLIIDAAGVKKRFDGLGPEKVVEIMASWAMPPTIFPASAASAKRPRSS